MELPGTLVCSITRSAAQVLIASLWGWRVGDYGATWNPRLSTTRSAAQVLITSLGLVSAVKAVQFFLNANDDPPYGQLPFHAA